MQMPVFYLPAMLNYSFSIYVMLLHEPKVHKGDTDLDILPPPPAALADMIQCWSPSSCGQRQEMQRRFLSLQNLSQNKQKEGKKIIP